MLEYPEINTIVKQMRTELPGKTVESGKLTKKNGNMFMGENDAAKYRLVNGGIIAQIDYLAPDIYIELDNGYGIMICQSGGKILYNSTQSDIPKNYNIIFTFTDGSSLTYTMSLFTLGIYAVSHEDWRNRKQSSNKFDPLGDSSYEDYINFIKKDETQEKTAVKLFLSNKIAGIMSTFAAEILLHAGIYPSTPLNKLSDIEHKRIYETMKQIITSANAQGGRTSEYDLYGRKGGYTAMAERKHIGGECPICGGGLEKNTTGGVTAYCPYCQTKK
ncbi:MAG: hypothetical protein FWG34_03430 [Oscillospiraceae bacterium]|nr:hypothetical protein [Oscillospiraceae bacterium]